jgi:hypothetical protein
LVIIPKLFICSKFVSKFEISLFVAIGRSFKSKPMPTIFFIESMDPPCRFVKSIFLYLSPLLSQPDPDVNILKNIEGENKAVKIFEDYAAAGVDFISLGMLTHSVKSMDISFKIK